MSSPIVASRVALLLVCAILLSAASAGAQGGNRGGGAGTGRGGGGGGGSRGRAVRVMTLTSTAFVDGTSTPARHTQAAEELSPPLAWTGQPDTVASYVLLFHDLDAATANGVDDLTHWLLWNIPGTATSLPQGIPHGPQLADGTRQISASGPYYRGPAAPATGPAHHYVFELFALDTLIEVPAVGAAPAATRAAVIAAMAGHVRGKGTLTTLYRRP